MGARSAEVGAQPATSAPMERRPQRIETPATPAVARLLRLNPHFADLAPIDGRGIINGQRVVPGIDPDVAN